MHGTVLGYIHSLSYNRDFQSSSTGMRTLIKRYPSFAIHITNLQFSTIHKCSVLQIVKCVLSVALKFRIPILMFNNVICVGIRSHLVFFKVYFNIKFIAGVSFYALP